MEGVHNDHRQRHSSIILELLYSHSSIEDCPANESWPKLEKHFQVEVPDAWVELAPDEKVVMRSTCVSCRGRHDAFTLCSCEQVHREQCGRIMDAVANSS